jgi:hypothetical protein
VLGGGIAVKRVLMMTGRVVLTGSVCPIRLKREARRVALAAVSAWVPAALCALAVPLGKWAQRKAASG